MSGKRLTKVKVSQIWQCKNANFNLVCSESNLLHRPPLAREAARRSVTQQKKIVVRVGRDGDYASAGGVRAECMGELER